MKDRGIDDPEMGPGWAYFVEHERYLEHVSKNNNTKEVGQSSTDLHCSFLITPSEGRRLSFFFPRHQSSKP